MRALKNRLSYSNVLATIALFVSLGGASYAAGVLPPYSVGPRQLQKGAVMPASLGFPLVSRGTVNAKTFDIQKEPCNSPPQPGRPAVTCPAVETRGLKAPGQEVQMDFRSGGQMAVSTVTGLRDEGAVGTAADVAFAIIADGKPVTEREVRIAGGEEIQVPVQALIHETRGVHVAGLVVSARYLASGQGDVIVGPVSVMVSAGP